VRYLNYKIIVALYGIYILFDLINQSNFSLINLKFINKNNESLAIFD